MSKNGETFRELQEFYNDTMEELEYELEELANEQNEGGVSDDEIENAVAAENHKMASAVMKTAVQAVGKCINDTVAAYDGGDDFKGEDTFRKGDHLYISAGAKSYHSVYVGCGKVVYYSKGYDFFPEIKIVPLGFFAKKGKVLVDSSPEAKFTPDVVVRRAMSRLGDNDFKNSESFVKWCLGQKEC